MRSTARALIARRAHHRVRIGFPRSDAFAPTSRVRSWDGWDYAATHRIVRLASGGTAIMLNDHCGIDFEPLPIIGCAFGEDSVRGDLFKHLRHRPAGGLP